MRHKNIFILAALTLFIISAALGYIAPKRHADFKSPAVPALVVKDFAREFSDLEAASQAKPFPEDKFTTLSGKTISIKDFGGKPTLVNLWATWCPPCVVELPSLQKLSEHYKDQMNVIALAADSTKTPAEISDFLEKRGISDFAGYVDQSGNIGKNLGVRGLPTSFLIGSNGLILYRFEGDADWAGEKSRAFFDTFLLQKF